MVANPSVSSLDQGIPAGRDLLWAVTGEGNWSGPPAFHIHRGFEVGVLLAGKVEMHFDQVAMLCRRGDVWLSNAYEPHGPRLARGPFRSVVLVFLPDFLGHEMLDGLPWPTLFAAAPEQRPRITSPELRRTVLTVAGLLTREEGERQRGWESAARFVLLHLLLELSRAWPEADRPDPPDHVQVGALTRLMPAIGLARSRPWRRVSVIDAAESCGLGRSHFQELFRATMGTSFGSFALRARLSFVAHRVSSTDRPIAAIASDAGFVDGSHLDRRFASHFGCTPGEYRRRARRLGAGEVHGTHDDGV